MKRIATTALFLATLALIPTTVSGCRSVKSIVGLCDQRTIRINSFTDMDEVQRLEEDGWDCTPDYSGFSTEYVCEEC